jgi:hypothetical protein
MNGSAPNCPLIGSHVRPVKKLNPNSRIESIEFEAIAMTIAVTIVSISKALTNRMARKIASPRLPVGESARRQFQACGRPSYAGDAFGGIGIQALSLKAKISNPGFQVAKV